MAKGWKQIYPRDVYRMLLIISGKTGISFPKIVNIIEREGLIYSPNLPDEWKLPPSTSQAHLLNPKPFQLEPDSLTKEESEKQRKLREWQKRFSDVIGQWDKIPEASKKYHIQKAKEYEEVIPNAKFVLALANGETVSLKTTEKGQS